MEDFLFDPLFAVLDAWEIGGRRLGDALRVLGRWGDRLDEPERRWITNAAFAYPNLLDAGLRARRGLWVTKSNGPNDVRELYTWGRCYVGADDERHRTLVLPQFVSVENRLPDPIKVAVAAYTTAFGRLAARPQPWSRAFALDAGDVEPSAVQVIAVGLADGSVREVFKGAPQAAKARYEDLGRPAVASLLDDGPTLPGRDCIDCRLLDECSAVPKMHSLMGIDAPTAPLRSVSATTLRYHAACPRQARLFGLHIGDSESESEPIRVGRAVDAWLDAAHGSRDHVGCGSVEVAAEMLTPSVNGIALTDAETARAVRLLRGHSETCPWVPGVEITDVRPQPTVVAFDPAASVVVYAKPDLLYREDGALVWRETTTSRFPPASRDSLFDTPKAIQIALAVLLCVGGVFGQDEHVARVEVEYLTDRGPDIRTLDLNDDANIARARTVLQNVVPAWFTDDRFNPTPGPACSWCQQRHWCRASLQGDDR